MNIKEKLNVLQTTLHVSKNQYNKFGNYKYRSLEDITLALKQPLKELQCILLMQSEILEVGGSNYVKSTVTLADCESDESISVSASAREATESKGMSPAQMTNTNQSPFVHEQPNKTKVRNKTTPYRQIGQSVGQMDGRTDGRTGHDPCS